MTGKRTKTNGAATDLLDLADEDKPEVVTVAQLLGEKPTKSKPDQPRKKREA